MIAIAAGWVPTESERLTAWYCPDLIKALHWERLWPRHCYHCHLEAALQGRSGCGEDCSRSGSHRPEVPDPGRV